ncbi:hypothetical protein GOBAR_DD36185 [Gossypium barbadense]|nr:hypothetical protein GOBAR_DD36185 [Gossypium barbadense]
MCQCGFYIYSIAALLTWETRRKDFAVMMSHHTPTYLSKLSPEGAPHMVRSYDLPIEFCLQLWGRVTSGDKVLRDL